MSSRVSNFKSAIFIPYIPFILPVTKVLRDNEFVRSVLIVDESKPVKPRLSWYDPDNNSWVPKGWFTDGVIADLRYYFGKNS